MLLGGRAADPILLPLLTRQGRHRVRTPLLPEWPEASEIGKTKVSTTPTPADGGCDAHDRARTKILTHALWGCMSLTIEPLCVLVPLVGAKLIVVINGSRKLRRRARLV